MKNKAVYSLWSEKTFLMRSINVVPFLRRAALIEEEYEGARGEILMDNNGLLATHAKPKAGQRAKEENSSEGNDVEEREKLLEDLKNLSGENLSGDGKIERMLLVEKGKFKYAFVKHESCLSLC
ncbi:hypothetical protein Ddye_012891 [Dipteronia dyeriana]|uniref:Uncharacterized protein n=1 Tax=Dipteronia dyeriana TaxID=168575 RepID=A0AAE0CJ46_9ROSI|nr:hypothetical protein Ddye_012891 [Dipteronia dyeriana]